MSAPEAQTIFSAESIAALAASHPCYSEEAGLRYGRMHLPVAPRCNLGCTYCERAVGRRAAALGGPGTAKRVISPREAAELVAAVAARGWLRVAGIAGPGEPLANSETFETLDLIGTSHPEIMLCLSTNGLLLADSLPRLLRSGLRSLTVTINTADPETASELYAWADLDGARVAGPEVAGEILARQWRGLAAASEAGLLIKVNSVLVPGINDVSLVEVARRAAELGAHRHNIMPLIPRGRMRARRAPSRIELQAIQQECERWIPQFRGCTQCPADVIRPPLLGTGGCQTCAPQSCTSAPSATRAATTA